MIQLWGGVATLVGSIIGAGILGIPFAVSQVGFGIGVALLIGLTLAMVILNIVFAELTLRTKKDHQMPGYSNMYLGKNAGIAALIIDLLSGYVTQLAYLVGLGHVLYAVLGMSPTFWSLFMLVFVTAIVYRGIEMIKRFETVLTIFVFLIVFVLAMLSSSHISVLNFAYWDMHHIAIPYGVLMFALAGHTSIPVVRRILKGKEDKFPHVIIAAYSIVFIVYLTFMYLVLGVTGQNTTEVATIGLGNAIGPMMVVMGNVLALFTMTTCYLTNGLSMRRIFQYDYKKSQLQSTLFALGVAPILFLLGLRDFIALLGVVGGLLLGAQSVLIIFSYWKAQKNGTRRPEFTFGPLHYTGIILLCVFALGAILTLLNR